MAQGLWHIRRIINYIFATDVVHLDFMVPVQGGQLLKGQYQGSQTNRCPGIWQVAGMYTFKHCLMIIRGMYNSGDLNIALINSWFQLYHLYFWSAVSFIQMAQVCMFYY